MCRDHSTEQPYPSGETLSVCVARGFSPLQLGQLRGSGKGGPVSSSAVSPAWKAKGTQRLCDFSRIEPEPGTGGGGGSVGHFNKASGHAASQAAINPAFRSESSTSHLNSALRIALHHPRYLCKILMLSTTRCSCRLTPEPALPDLFCARLAQQEGSS